MVNCAIMQCPNRSGGYRAHHKRGVRFFSIPTKIVNQCDLTRSRTERRRTTWLARINRKDLCDANVKPSTRVCSRHFISGQPSTLWDESNPDWAPSQHLGYSFSKPASSTARYYRANKRTEKKSSASNWNISSLTPHECKYQATTSQEPAEENNTSLSVNEPLYGNVDIKFEPDQAQLQCFSDNIDIKVEPDQDQLQCVSDVLAETVSETVNFNVLKANYEDLQEQHTALKREHIKICKFATNLTGQIEALEYDKCNLLISLRSAEGVTESMKEKLFQMMELQSSTEKELRECQKSFEDLKKQVMSEI